MNNRSVGELSRNPEEKQPLWPSPRVDEVVSIVLAFLSVLVGGLGLYLVLRDWNWAASPLVFLGLVMWGVSCFGLRRLFLD